MLVASVQFQVKRDKRSEFVRTAENFVATLRQARGCVECRLLSDCEVRGSYTLVTQWEGPVPLRAFLGSNDFRALLGTRILLHDPPRICVDEVLRRTRLTGRGDTELQW
jgi:quinol monooxygenase YgiN